MFGARIGLHIFLEGSVIEARYCIGDFLHMDHFRGVMVSQFLCINDNATPHSKVAAL